jgi:hypothetical protein
MAEVAGPLLQLADLVSHCANVVLRSIRREWCQVKASLQIARPNHITRARIDRSASSSFGIRSSS